jgi:hypothetical protein
MFSKHSGSWIAYERKEAKSFDYMPTLINNFIEKIKKIQFSKTVIFQPDDPRNKASHIAPIPAPSTADIVATRTSRFKSKN